MGLSGKTKLEMEMGRRRARLNALMDQIHDGELRLRKAFPRLGINLKIPYPYETVELSVFIGGGTLALTTTDPVETFPTDELVTKLALIA
jgi:hypothetical protein